MSEEELVSAYLDGRVSRRVFIRRLMTTGLSAGAALGLASVVGPAAFGQAGEAGSGLNGGNGGYKGSGGLASGGSGTSGGLGGGTASKPGGLPGS